MPRVDVGDVVPHRELRTIHRSTVLIPDPSLTLHLQFRRFAGCPVCNLHLRSFARSHDAIRDARIREIVVFHSTVEELLRYQAELPFEVVADPDRKLYAEFGVESAARSVLDPRSWPAVIRGTLAMRSVRNALTSEDHLGLPADFLITAGDRDGRVHARKYGSHADDQWSVDELLSLSRKLTT